MSKTIPSVDVMMGQLDKYMHHMVMEELSGKILQMTEYHLGWRDAQFELITHANMGKRGRPMLALLVSLLFHDEFKRVFPVATAIELVHNFSLIFDDIQDRDSFRRGRPAVWSLWGEDEAINVGCALQTLASLALSDMAHYFPQVTVHETQRYLNRIMLRLCSGQQLDISMTKSKGLISLDEYLTMISGKTAALFEAAAYLGALCSDATTLNGELCREFGYLLGICFQLFDDAVGVSGSTQLDKPSLDLEKRKKTYPIIYTYNVLRDDEQLALLSIYYSDGELDNASLATIRGFIEKTGALQQTVNRGYHYLDIAMQKLNQIDGNPSIKRAITEWIDFVTTKQLESIQDQVGVL